jgi:hypothetical protein
MAVPGFTAEASIFPSRVRYRTEDVSIHRGITLLPAQTSAVADPCILHEPNIRVGWQPFQDNRNGTVIVTGRDFAPRSLVQLRFDNCTSAFLERSFSTTDACGNFTTWHNCTCEGPPIAVQAFDSSGNSAAGMVRQTC